MMFRIAIGCWQVWQRPVQHLRSGCRSRTVSGSVVVPAGVGAAFVVVEPELVFELAVVELDLPAQVREPDELCGRV